MERVEIYTTAWCGFCHAAKRLLTDKGARFTEYDVEVEPAQRAAMAQRAGGARTVPQIFIGGVPVGGCQELYALERAGKLDGLLGTSCAQP